MDPQESVRTEFMRELCRSLEEAGSIGGAGAGAQGGGGASSLRFMAYLCLVATEVRISALDAMCSRSIRAKKKEIFMP